MVRLIYREIRHDVTSIAKEISASIMRGTDGLPSKPPRKAELVALFASIIGRDYATAISRVALIGSFSTLQSALKFASRGLT